MLSRAWITALPAPVLAPICAGIWSCLSIHAHLAAEVLLAKAERLFTVSAEIEVSVELHGFFSFWSSFFEKAKARLSCDKTKRSQISAAILGSSQFAISSNEIGRF